MCADPSPTATLAQAALPDPPAEPAAAVDPGVLWGYSPLLHPRALQRGLLQHGDPARMRRFVAKLLKVGQGTVQ